MLSAYFVLHVSTHFGWSIWKSVPVSRGTHTCIAMLQLSMWYISLPINWIVSNCNLQVACILPFNKVAGSNFWTFLIEVAQSRMSGHCATKPQCLAATSVLFTKLRLHGPHSAGSTYCNTHFGNVEMRERVGNETYRNVRIDCVEICACVCIGILALRSNICGGHLQFSCKSVEICGNSLVFTPKTK